MVLARLRLAVRGRRFWFVCLCGGRMIKRMRHWYWGSDKHGLSRVTREGLKEENSSVGVALS